MISVIDITIIDDVNLDLLVKVEIYRFCHFKFPVFPFSYSYYLEASH